ncbi:MAG: hypothetical protein JWP63_7098 [Candidatus Solibacter sp.]|nr:hypothetical protein [Candidatus Solibacter sp.]
MGTTARFPAAGAAVVVANHPYGIVEGLILAAVLDRVRPDWTIMVNSMLAGVVPLLGRMIPVNPFDAPTANAVNRAPLRESMRQLAADTALVIFPAGEVAQLDWTQRSIADPPWKTTAARLAHAPGAALCRCSSRATTACSFR